MTLCGHMHCLALPLTTQQVAAHEGNLEGTSIYGPSLVSSQTTNKQMPAGLQLTHTDTSCCCALIAQQPAARLWPDASACSVARCMHAHYTAAADYWHHNQEYRQQHRQRLIGGTATTPAPVAVPPPVAAPTPVPPPAGGLAPTAQGPAA